MDTLHLDHPSGPMTDEECWERLREAEVGRLAYRLVDEVHLVPINVVVVDDALLFRTTAGGKLLAAALESEVAFEIDWIDVATAWSVVVRGRLHRLEELERHRLDGAAAGWLGRDLEEVVELVPSEVSGRWFHLRGRH
ncbi:pyridoxamine 5'-phosphate oxidase family protein [Nocardioides aequoreus]|uniref:pyridoxamine 5'-phosphate oxidase family protein n=1 Tax=Nocardioides aequoreus TaxID=397278 RepID=UPI00068B12A5|nr:pyridoxamine 5'-phosphate oxidase family protein [Nocardioides aequoreus]